MQSISDLIKLPEIIKNKKTSERNFLLGSITEELNKDRKPPYKPLTYPRVGKMLAHLEVKDLYYILSMRKEVKNWGKWFWWSLKQPVDK